MVPSVDSVDLAARLPQGELEPLYPDAGHGGIFQYHDMFVPRALEFLEPYPAAWPVQDRPRTRAGRTPGRVRASAPRDGYGPTRRPGDVAGPQERLVAEFHLVPHMGVRPRTPAGPWLRRR